jgi:plasmid replication initiation protein
LQRNFDNEVERLNQKLARLSLQKEQAGEKLQVYGNDMRFIWRQGDEAMTAQATTEHALADL